MNAMRKGLFARSMPLVAGLVLSTTALAQTVQPRDPNMPDPKSTVPEKVDPPQTSVSGNPGQSLSDKLEKSEGVITPRTNLDPGIRVPAPVPNPGTTPVIPPPGEPGGNQSVQPK